MGWEGRTITLLIFEYNNRTQEGIRSVRERAVILFFEYIL
jgi:hypothetical protein